MKLSGRLYFPDGTLATERMVVRAQLDVREGSFEVAADSHSSGSFELELDREQQRVVGDGHNLKHLRFSVSDRVIEPDRVWQIEGRDQEWAILLPQELGGWGATSEAGGLITGVIVDSDGKPRRGGCEIRAEIGGGGWFSFGDSAEALTDPDDGSFVLELRGGVQVKELTIDGNKPVRIWTEERGEERELRPADLRAGTFGVRLERRAKMFGF